MPETFVILDCPGRYGPRGARNNERCTPKTLGQNFKGGYSVPMRQAHIHVHGQARDGTLTTPIAAKGPSHD